MKRLSPYFVRKTLEAFSLSEPVRKHIQALLELSEADDRIKVSRILETLFPLSTTASANSSLNRLLAAINKMAKERGLSFEVRITTDKKAGAANRWIWFEGPTPGPGPAHTSELNSIRPDQFGTVASGCRPKRGMVIRFTWNVSFQKKGRLARPFHPLTHPSLKKVLSPCPAIRIGVRSCAVSPDGLRVISAGDDSTIRFWNTETFALLMPVIHSGRDDWVVIDYQNNRVVQCGPEAWRHLAWQSLDAEGRINRFPVEIEGPLPIKEF
ncbi:MAG: hypothetical protein V2B20_16005 [Pseudomonadota bacterium]